MGFFDLRNASLPHFNRMGQQKRQEILFVIAQSLTWALQSVFKGCPDLLNIYAQKPCQVFFAFFFTFFAFSFA